jgi:hypothetical protein
MEGTWLVSNSSHTIGPLIEGMVKLKRIHGRSMVGGKKKLKYDWSIMERMVLSRNDMIIVVVVVAVTMVW